MASGLRRGTGEKKKSKGPDHVICPNKLSGVGSSDNKETGTRIGHEWNWWH